MNNYGNVENYCKELQRRIKVMEDLAPGVPAAVAAEMRKSCEVLSTVYFDLVDSDLYRK